MPHLLELRHAPALAPRRQRGKKSERMFLVENDRTVVEKKFVQEHNHPFSASNSADTDCRQQTLKRFQAQGSLCKEKLESLKKLSDPSSACWRHTYYIYQSHSERKFGGQSWLMGRPEKKWNQGGAKQFPSVYLQILNREHQKNGEDERKCEHAIRVPEFGKRTQETYH